MTPITGSTFFVAMFAGLILALGFQLVLTNLSLAAGVSAVGDLRAPHAPRAARADGPRGLGARARAFTAAIGLWALVTASVALFFASWLAVELSFTAQSVVAVVLALVIWGLFYLVTMTVEAAAVSSLVGALFRTIRDGLRAGWRSATSVFATSPEDRVVDTARRVTRAVSRELQHDRGLVRLRRDVERYLDQADATRLDAATVRQEIMTFLQDVELRSVTMAEGPLLDRETIVTRLQQRPGFTVDQARAVAGGVVDTLEGLRRDARVANEQVDAWLRSTGKQALDPDAVRGDLVRLLSEPAAASDALRARLGELDRDAIRSALEYAGGLTPERAQEVTEWVEDAIRAAGVFGRVVSRPVSRDAIAARVQSWLDTLGAGQASDADTLLHLFDDPKASADVLIRRLRGLDLRALVASRTGWDEARVAQLVAQLEGARDTVVSGATRARDEVAHRVEAARRDAWAAAEEARKTTAAAAWWGLGTAVVSGGAAVAGGLVAVAL